MTMIATDHIGDDGACHVKEPFNIGVNHRFPIVFVAFIFGFKTKGKASVVDEHVNSFPVLGQVGISVVASLTVADVVLKGQDVTAKGASFFGDSIQSVSVAAREDEVIAAFGKTLGTSASDTACSACNKSYFINIID